VNLSAPLPASQLALINRALRDIGESVRIASEALEEAARAAASVKKITDTWSRAQLFIVEQYNKSALAKKRKAHAHKIAVNNSQRKEVNNAFTIFRKVILEVKQTLPQERSSPPTLHKTFSARKSDDLPSFNFARSTFRGDS
jgi:hypothetical protein